MATHSTSLVATGREQFGRITPRAKAPRICAPGARALGGEPEAEEGAPERRTPGADALGPEQSGAELGRDQSEGQCEAMDTEAIHSICE